MRTLNEVEHDAIDRMPFSNSTEGDTWMARWCDMCVHDAPARRGDYANACPLVAVALTGVTPAEWEPLEPLRLGEQYRCTEYEPEGETSA